MNRRMKDSSVEWIGHIPQNWKLVKYKRFAKSGMGITLLKSDVFEKKENNAIPIYSATKEDIFFGYTDNKSLLLEKGDLVIPARGNSIGNIKIVEEQATSTQTTIYSKIFSENIYINFIKYCGDGLKDNWFEFDNTAIPQITVHQVNNNLVPYPDLDEQKKIISILDEKTKKIEKLISETKYSIIELKKYKQSIITEAVTKGLNPNVERKNSEIEWISKTPNHWSTRKINNYFFQVKNKNDTLEEANLLSLSYGTIVKRDIKSTSGLLPDNFKSYNIIQKGDIILRMTDLQNDKVSLRTAYSEENGIITSAYITIRTKLDNLIYSKYIQYFLHSFDINKGFYGMGNGVRQNVTYNDIKKIEILVPPLSEQHEIIMFLDTKTRLIDKLIEDKTKLIEELENYRKSVIYEYVTGKKEA